MVGDELVARHPRSWGRGHEFNPVHYLALLERKPGAFDYARPLENWELPDCFGVLRRRLEAELERHGTREFIKVLRLLEHATLPKLRPRWNGLSIGVADADAVRLILEHGESSRSVCSVWTVIRICRAFMCHRPIWRHMQPCGGG